MANELSPKLPIYNICIGCNTYRDNSGQWNPAFQPEEEHWKSHGYCEPYYEKALEEVEEGLAKIL